MHFTTNYWNEASNLTNEWTAPYTIASKQQRYAFFSGEV